MCEHEIKCCNFCLCHYKICQRCQKNSILCTVQIPENLKQICWGCPKCASYIPFKKKDLNKFSIIKK